LPSQPVSCAASSAIRGDAGDGTEAGDLLPHLRDVVVEQIDATLSAVVITARWRPPAAVPGVWHLVSADP
jgi:hypothetical protein